MVAFQTLVIPSRGPVDSHPVTRGHLPYSHMGVTVTQAVLTQIWEALHSFSGNHGTDFMGQWG